MWKMREKCSVKYHIQICQCMGIKSNASEDPLVTMFKIATTKKSGVKGCMDNIMVTIY